MRAFRTSLMFTAILLVFACEGKIDDVTIGMEGTILESIEGNMEDLLSFGDPLEKTFYVAEGQEEAAIARFKGELIDTQTVVLNINDQQQEYTLMPMSKLNFNAKLKEGQYGTFKNYVCDAVLTEGKCVNLRSTSTGKFVCSIKIPEGGLSYCRKEKNEECDWIMVKFTGQTWKQRNCKGARAGNKLIRVCYNNNT